MMISDDETPEHKGRNHWLLFYILIYINWQTSTCPTIHIFPHLSCVFSREVSTKVISISFCCFDKLTVPQRSCWGRGNYLFSCSQVPWQVTKKSIQKSDCPLHPPISNVMALCVSCVHCNAPDQAYIKSASMSWLKWSLLRFVVGQLHLLKTHTRVPFLEETGGLQV